MPFGKYRGQVITTLPDEYMDWLLTLELRDPLKQVIHAEVGRRARIRDAQRAASLVTDEVLDAAREIIRSGVRALTRERHPDAGGSTAAMAAVNNAAELLRAVLGEVMNRCR